MRFATFHFRYFIHQIESLRKPASGFAAAATLTKMASATTPTGNSSATSTAEGGPSLAIVFGTSGGMSDVGKFVAMHALKMNQTAASLNLRVRLVAMSLEAEEGTDKGFSPEVTDTELQREVAQTLLAEDRARVGGVVKVDVGDHEASVRALTREFEGVDAVVACVGNRQPSKARWLAPATQQVTEAMANAGVTRLVQLSSMGVGDDKLRFSFIKALWWTMMRTMLRSARADLEAAEHIVRATPCDYLLVRPMGITPSEAPRGSWTILHKEPGRLGISIAKSDVAKFMLQEALEPSFSRTAVTIGPGPDPAATPSGAGK